MLLCNKLICNFKTQLSHNKKVEMLLLPEGWCEGERLQEVQLEEGQGETEWLQHRWMILVGRASMKLPQSY